MSPRKAPRYATAESVWQQSGQWDREVLDCRAYGHDWKPRTAKWNGPRVEGSLLCDRCEAAKSFTLDGTTGEVLKSSISYADGYLVKDMGRIVGEAKGALRLAAIAHYVPVVVRRRRRGAA